jgi:hypothetical protein
VIASDPTVSGNKKVKKTLIKNTFLDAGNYNAKIM